MEGKLFEELSTLERMKNWKRLSFPLQYGLGLMRFKLPRLLSPLSPTAELIGHAGASSAFLFHSDVGQLYIGGTLNQLQNQGRPFRLMLKVVSILGGKTS
jgi:D-alanyl-D-alanine carboxypeptidase